VGRPHLPGWYPSSEGDLRSLIVGNLHYLTIDSGAERLYDTSIDFAEQNDLSRDPAYVDSLQLARRLMAGIKR
jgi:hypothetical protein